MLETETVEILLVEDNPADAELALHALKKSKVANHILHVRDGAEALDFFFAAVSFPARCESASRAGVAGFEAAKIGWAASVETNQERPAHQSDSGYLD